MKPCCVLVWLFIAAAAHATLVQHDAAAPWPLFGRDPQHTSRSVSIGPEQLPSILWQKKLLELTSCSPTIDRDGNIYVSGQNGLLTAYAPNGVQKWVVDLRVQLTSPPAWDPHYRGHLCGGDTILEVTTEGLVQWKEVSSSFSLRGPVNLGPNGYTYAPNSGNGLSPGGVVCVNASGDTSWKYGAPGAVHNAPAVSPDGSIVCADTFGNVIGLTWDGSFRWLFATGASVQGSATIGLDGTTYVASSDFHCYAVSTAGFQVWRTYIGGNVLQNLAMGLDGSLYMATFGGALMSLTSGGLLRWSQPLDGTVRGPIALDANDNVYVGTDGKSLYSFDKDGGQRWRLPLLGSISLAGVIIDGDGNLVVADKGPWLYKIGPKVHRILFPSQLSDYFGITDGIPVRFELREVNTHAIVQLRDGWINAAGEAVLDTNRVGPTLIVVKPDHWLSRTATLEISGDVNGPSMEFSNGDLTRDDIIDDGDLIQCIISFGQLDLTNDLDGDGYVEDGELLILIVNFGSVGEGYGL